MTTTHHPFDDLILLKFESVQLRSPTIIRVTFYEGKPPLEFIRERVGEIFSHNRWLQGRLIRANKKLVLRYPKQPLPVDRFVQVVSIPGLRHDAGFAELTDALRGLVVKRGAACVDQDEDLFRVVVVNISDDRFAVVASMSHVIADGHTFYQIYKMLSATETVRPLVIERFYDSRNAIDAAIRGGDEALPWLSSPGFIVNVAGSLLRREIPTFNLFTVDQDAIERQKQEYASSRKPGYITTNDIITSEFFNNTDCDLLFTTVNFRGRVPGLTLDHAGNYECVIAFQREDFARPELIRQAWSDYRRAVSGKLPGFFKSTRVKMGALTNLASFYQDVELPGSKLSFHRPVVVDTTPFAAFENTVYIFRSNRDQLSLLTSAKQASRLSNMTIVKERVV